MSAIPPKNHYATLGLHEQVTPEEIKAEYRRLVLLHHPDVSKAGNAADKFREIAEAYQILSDPLERSSLDAELLLYRSKQMLNGSSFPPNPFENPPPRPEPKHQPAREQPVQSPFVPSAADQQREARKAESQAIKYAQELVESGRTKARFHPREALDLAKRALRANSRSAEAAELAGQMYEKLGRDDEALGMYTVAIQCDPRNVAVKKAFSRLSGIRETRPTMNSSRPKPIKKARFWNRLFGRR